MVQSVVFVCTFNAVRSPMAEALARLRTRNRLYMRSCGLRSYDAVDPFAVAVMEEIGVDLSDHKPTTYAALADDSFDLIVTLSPDAHHRALELTRTSAVEIEYWPTLDPTGLDGSRAQRMDAYRSVRDQIDANILRRLKASAPP